MIHAGSIAGEEVDDPVDPDNYNEAADGDWLPQVRQRLSRRYPAMHCGYGRGGYGALDPGPLPRPGRDLLCRRFQWSWIQNVADRRPTAGRADRRWSSDDPGHHA